MSTVYDPAKSPSLSKNEKPHLPSPVFQVLYTYTYQYLVYVLHMTLLYQLHFHALLHHYLNRYLTRHLHHHRIFHLIFIDILINSFFIEFDCDICHATIFSLAPATLTEFDLKVFPSYEPSA